MKSARFRKSTHNRLVLERTDETVTKEVKSRLPSPVVPVLVSLAVFRYTIMSRR